MLAVALGLDKFRHFLGRHFTVVTDHNALVTLFNGNIKKNKILFSRLIRWIDRTLPFYFEIENMPGPKSVWPTLSRHPDGVASSVSVYDILFTVIKVRSINKSLGYRNLDNTIGVVKTKSRKSNASPTKNAICKCGCETPPDEGGTSCVQESTNHMADICISECNDRDEVKVVKSISECKLSECQINFFSNLYSL